MYCLSALKDMFNLQISCSPNKVTHLAAQSLIHVLCWDLLALHSSPISCAANSIWNANQSLEIMESNPASFCSVCWMLTFVYAQAQRHACSHTSTHLMIRCCSPVLSGWSRIYGNTSILTPVCQSYINPDISLPTHHSFTFIIEYDAWMHESMDQKSWFMLVLVIKKLLT